MHIRRAALSVVVTLISITASAQQRTFVSTAGTDNPTCSRTAPCRNFAAAVAAVVDGGEVVALDSGGYGPVTIDKSVSIIGAPGAYVGISVFSGAGVTVNAPGAATVVLRNLHLNSVGGNIAIEEDAAANLRIENVVIAHFATAALAVTAVQTNITVRDSEFRDGALGVFLGAGTIITGSIEHTRFDNNSAAGLVLNGGSQVAVRDSTFFGNDAGIVLQPSANVPADVTVDNSIFSDGSKGIYVNGSGQAPATARVGRTTFIYLVNGVIKSAGSNFLRTWGNNQFDANGTNGSFDLSGVVQ
jgi:hypothetical protein